MIRATSHYSHSGPAHKARVFFRMVGALLDRRFTGRVFGGYRLEKVLGQGRFATCFLARPEGACSSADDASRRVVLKLVKPQCGRMDAEAVWAECRVLQVSDHPGIPRWLGIVNCYERGEAFGSGRTFSCRQNPPCGSAPSHAFASHLLRPKPYFIVESLMLGRSLQHWLQRDAHVFTMAEIREIGLQLIELLEHLEERGALHGDLRPANVMYDGSRVSLIDFGLSEWIDPKAPPANAAAFFAPDRDGLASVLLFLLYSDESRIKPGIKGTWREELNLSPALRQLLEDLFDESHPWASYAEVRKRFLSAC